MLQRGASGAAALLIVLNIALIGLTAWKIWQASQPQPPPAEPQSVAKADDTTITSAKGTFRITFPAGWDGVLRVMDGDRFVVPGPRQPAVSSDRSAKVQDIATYSGAELLVFEAVVSEDLPSPDGQASDLLIGEGSSLLSGRKYVHKYSGNNLTGLRKNGDLDYVYSFSLGGKRELRVTYRVYADDPTDNSQTVEAIVHSIRRQ